jgi:hypothetical protein
MAERGGGAKSGRAAEGSRLAFHLLAANQPSQVQHRQLGVLSRHRNRQANAAVRRQQRSVSVTERSAQIW